MFSKSPSNMSLGRDTKDPSLSLPAHTKCEITPNPTNKTPLQEMIAEPQSSQELCCHLCIHQMHLVGGEKA